MEERSEPISRQHHRSEGAGTVAKMVMVLALLAGAGYAWWHWESRTDMLEGEPTREQLAELPQPMVSEPISTAAAEPAEGATPIEPAPDTQGNPPLAATDSEGLGQAVTQWLGRERTLRFVDTEGLARRIVATVDNLPRSQAAVGLWPLHPVGGRMQVRSTDDGGLTIAPENAARYDAVVRFVVGLDVHEAGALYRRIYPVLQQTYEALGFPGKAFHERLVAVIDHLLKTPEPTEPLALKLVQVQGQVVSQQPWLRYEFADGELQSLSAGQKILLRMGQGHTQRIKAQLREVRAQITQP